MLYTMLDSNSQKWILSKIKSIKFEDIRIKDIFDFSGQIELIRRIRNTTNHYEPTVAFFINNIKEKRLENSKTLETIKMLNIKRNRFSYTKRFYQRRNNASPSI